MVPVRKQPDRRAKGGNNNPNTNPATPTPNAQVKYDIEDRMGRTATAEEIAALKVMQNNNGFNMPDPEKDLKDARKKPTTDAAENTVASSTSGGIPAGNNSVGHDQAEGTVEPRPATSSNDADAKRASDHEQESEERIAGALLEEGIMPAKPNNSSSESELGMPPRGQTSSLPTMPLFDESAPPNELPMFHSRHLEWKDGIAIISSRDRNAVREVIHSSVLYKQGGLTYRVMLPSGIQIDIMVCETSICSDCTGSLASTTTPTLLSSLPFVHLHDLLLKDVGPNEFNPRAKLRNGLQSSAWQDSVVFKGRYGNIISKASVCRGCEYCIPTRSAANSRNTKGTSTVDNSFLDNTTLAADPALPSPNIWSNDAQMDVLATTQNLRKTSTTSVADDPADEDSFFDQYLQIPTESTGATGTPNSKPASPRAAQPNPVERASTVHKPGTTWKMVDKVGVLGLDVEKGEFSDDILNKSGNMKRAGDEDGAKDGDGCRAKKAPRFEAA